ncbi:hypothetical protein AVEN_96477-1 [Araneus ventricosus]|uniref:Uncharacterized protein n=1 Tax=Araneus ventricosus TaxID=182803 RepID=A0A4Y2CVV6_ARAVE|nr:hypothetical protein AVEN_96477-1 [Araneus ventricosus]
MYCLNILKTTIIRYISLAQIVNISENEAFRRRSDAVRKACRAAFSNLRLTPPQEKRTNKRECEMFSGAAANSPDKDMKRNIEIRNKIVKENKLKSMNGF